MSVSLKKKVKIILATCIASIAVLISFADGVAINRTIAQMVNLEAPASENLEYNGDQRVNHFYTKPPGASNSRVEIEVDLNKFTFYGDNGLYKYGFNPETKNVDIEVPSNYNFEIFPNSDSNILTI
jgi:hypothetical protein